MKNLKQMALLLTLAAIMLAGCNSTEPTTQQASYASSQANSNSDQPQLITENAGASVVTAGNYIFWSSETNKRYSLYGYDLTKHTQFLIAGSGHDLYQFVSDGSKVVWVGSLPGNGNNITGLAMQVYDLSTGRSSTLRPSVLNMEQGNLALSNGILYYDDSAPGHAGTFALNMATNQEKLIGNHFQNGRVIADGKMLWTTEQLGGGPCPCLSSTNLHMTELDMNTKDVVVANALSFEGYVVSGDHIVYAALSAGNRSVYEYTISSGQSQLLSSNASWPTVSGNQIAWVDGPQSGSNGSRSYSIRTLQTGADPSKAVTVITSAGSGIVSTNFTDNEKLDIIVKNTSNPDYSVYLVGRNQVNTVLTNQSSTNPNTHNACTDLPINCGQVTIASDTRLLSDNGGVWRMQGVMFALPEVGINGNAFTASAYSAAKNRICGLDTRCRSGDVRAWGMAVSDKQRAAAIPGSRLARQSDGRQWQGSMVGYNHRPWRDEHPLLDVQILQAFGPEGLPLC